MTDIHWETATAIVYGLQNQATLFITHKLSWIFVHSSVDSAVLSHVTLSATSRLSEEPHTGFHVIHLTGSNHFCSFLSCPNKRLHISLFPSQFENSVFRKPDGLIGFHKLPSVLFLRRLPCKQCQIGSQSLVCNPQTQDFDSAVLFNTGPRENWLIPTQMPLIKNTSTPI